MVEKSCATCRFMSVERPQAGMIAPVMMCRHGPLIAVAIPNSGGLQIRAMCPAVSPADWCHRYDELPSANN